MAFFDRVFSVYRVSGCVELEYEVKNNLSTTFLGSGYSRGSNPEPPETYPEMYNIDKKLNNFFNIDRRQLRVVPMNSSRCGESEYV